MSCSMEGGRRSKRGGDDAAHNAIPFMNASLPLTLNIYPLPHTLQDQLSASIDRQGLECGLRPDLDYPSRQPPHPTKHLRLMEEPIHPPPVQAAQDSPNGVLQEMKEWFTEHGGSLHQVDVAIIDEAEGCGLVAQEPVKAGQLVLRVPISLCVHVEAVHLSVLRDVVAAEPQLLAEEAQDELLALVLMAERRAGRDSFWWPYLKVMPGEYDTPLYWGEEERRYLAGTNVGLLTVIMERRIAQDWKENHAGLVQKYPDVLGGLTLQDYIWALSTIWSRAVGVERGVGHRYLRCLAPALDMCNHHPSAAMGLEDLLKYEAETDSLCFRPATPVTQGQQCHLLYGPYSNAKLLYSYGFVAAQNPHRGVDYWVKVPSTAFDAAWKTEELLAHDLTREQTYDFNGTLLGNGVTTALMATVRMIHLTPEEYKDVEKVFRGEIVSLRNEQASFNGLATFLEKKVSSYPTTVEEDLRALEKLERILEAAQGEEAKGEMGLRIGLLAEGGTSGVPFRSKDEDAEEREGGQAPRQQKAGLRRALRRRACALKVMLEDKMVFQETLACVTHRLGELR